MKENALTLQKQKILTFLVIAAIIGGFLFLRSYFSLIAVSIVLAFLFNPVYKWALKKFKNKNGYAITTTVVTLFLTFAIPVSAILYITVLQAIEIIDLVRQATADSGSFQEAINNIVNGLDSEIKRVPGLSGVDISGEQVFGWLQTAAETILSSSVSFVKGFVGGIAGFFTNLIIFLFVFSSLLKHQDSILKALQDINPLGKSTTDLYLGKMGAMTTAMVKGQFVIAVAQGLSGTISLWIAGIDYLVFWFVLLTFLSIIPLGGGIILIPLGIVLILTGNVWQGILILLWHFLITTNIDNILRPKFVPKSAQLDPALTILSVFAGIAMFGFLGIVLGPVLMIVIVTTINAYLEFKRTGKIVIMHEDDVKKPGFFKRLSTKILAHK